MNATNETVREVCADAKRTSTNWIRTMNVLGVMPTRECIHRWCDRILSAYEREMVAKDAEIARREAALKPVMECKEESCRAFGDHYLMLDDAVREAQRVMKEGEGK